MAVLADILDLRARSARGVVATRTRSPHRSVAVRFRYRMIETSVPCTPSWLKHKFAFKQRMIWAEQQFLIVVLVFPPFVWCAWNARCVGRVSSRQPEP